MLQNSCNVCGSCVDWYWFCGLRADMNIISWSPMGRIAASFGLDLVVWMPRSDDTVVYRLQGIIALEYSADGKLLAACVQRKDSNLAGKTRLCAPRCRGQCFVSVCLCTSPMNANVDKHMKKCFCFQMK